MKKNSKCFATEHRKDTIGKKNKMLLAGNQKMVRHGTDAVPEQTSQEEGYEKSNATQCAFVGNGYVWCGGFVGNFGMGVE